MMCLPLFCSAGQSCNPTPALAGRLIARKMVMSVNDSDWCGWPGPAGSLCAGIGKLPNTECYSNITWNTVAADQVR